MARLVYLALVLALAATRVAYAQPAALPIAGDAVLTDLLAGGAVPGSAGAVWADGAVAWSGGAGFADLEHRVPATAQTRFGIGSVSKVLTTALVGRLVEAGLLDLDAPIETYLPDFPHAGRGVTIRLVASHLSGLTDRFNAANRYATRAYSTAEALREIYNEDLVADPGEASRYATGSYTLIAGAVEAATGVPFTEAMRTHVLGPLGLASVAPNDPAAIVRDRTEFYEDAAEGRLVNAPYFDPSYKLAGAGYLASAEDLARFGAALLAPGFLSGPTLDALFTAVTPTGGDAPEFGLGWRVGAAAGFGMDWVVGPDEGGYDVVHQPGGGPGISCWIVLLRDAGVVAVLMANHPNGAVGGARMDRLIDAALRHAESER